MATSPAQPQSCPIQMETGACGRPIHTAPQGIDDVPVCLMHSKDPAKHTGNPLYSQFFLEFKSILKKAGQGTADFAKFVFPYLSLRSTTIDAECRFHEAVFEEDLHLYEVEFKRNAWFTGATFLQSLSCSPASFKGDTDFEFVKFRDGANFNGAIFHKSATFFGSEFNGIAIFKEAIFKDEAEFNSITFERAANFEKATFEATARFEHSAFSFPPALLDTVFRAKADFSHAKFVRGATFPRTQFLEDVLFVESTFTEETKFLVTQFHKAADFSSARFLAAASFRDTRFRSDDSLEPGPIFSLARFSPDGDTEFYKTDLSHALFHNCDISSVRFSSVTWRKRPHTDSLMVFEEDVPLIKPSTLRLHGGVRDYGLIAQLYQQLKKNYDDHLDYWAADHFHYGEMEMQRLAVPTTGVFLGLRQFYHRNLSLIAWYCRGSSYGNSYLRPAAWLVGILLLFTLLFPLTGLQRTNANTAAPPTPPLTYRSVWPSQSSLHDKLWAEVKLLGKSSLTTIDTATFQKNSEYLPTYPWGRSLAILETLLTATLFALFLLAIRRKFRR